MAELIKDQKSKAELMTYPAAKRRWAMLGKIAFGALLGTGVVAGVVVVSINAHILLLLAIFAGAGLYAVKETRAVYLRNKHERELTEKLNREAEAAKKEIDQIDFEKLKQTVDLLVEHPEHFRPDEKERLYAQLYELQQAMKTLMPYLAVRKSKTTNNNAEVDRYLDALKMNASKLDALKNRVNETRGVKKDDLPDATYLQIRPTPKPPLVQRSLASRFWTYTKKAANRFLSFGLGMSSGVAIGMGVLTVVVGAVGVASLLSNPVGWAMLGIIGVGLVVGAAAVAMDYLVTRPQERKIHELSAAKHKVQDHGTNAQKIRGQLLELHEHKKVFINEQKLKHEENNRIFLELQSQGRVVEQHKQEKTVLEETVMTKDQEIAKQAALIKSLEDQLRILQEEKAASPEEKRPKAEAEGRDSERPHS